MEKMSTSEEYSLFLKAELDCLLRECSLAALALAYRQGLVEIVETNHIIDTRLEGLPFTYYGLNWSEINNEALYHDKDGSIAQNDVAQMNFIADKILSANPDTDERCYVLQDGDHSFCVPVYLALSFLPDIVRAGGHKILVPQKGSWVAELKSFGDTYFCPNYKEMI